MTNEFPYQLTHSVRIRATLNFAIEQLEQYGDIEGIDFIAQCRQTEIGKEYSVFTRGKRRGDSPLYQRKYITEMTDHTEDTHESPGLSADLRDVGVPSREQASVI